MSETKQKYSVSIERDADYEPQRLVVSAITTEHIDNGYVGSNKIATTPELMPCPFCGEPVNYTNHDNGYWSVYCINCVARGPRFLRDPEGARAAWNRRAAAADVTQLFDEVLAHLEVALFATHPDAAAIVAPYRERLAELLGDRVK